MMSFSINFTLLLLTLAYFVLLMRVIKGPSSADKVVAIDLIAVNSVAYLLLISLKSDEPLYIDIAIALAFVGFLATVACSRYILYEEKDES